MWNSLKKFLFCLFPKRTEEGKKQFDPERRGEERFEPERVGNVEPAQEPKQDARELAPEPGVGPFNNAAKDECRSYVIKHAIRCLTTERHTSACVQRDHVRQVWQQLRESGECQAFFRDQKVIKSIETEISCWESLHDGKISRKKASELNVCYLGGENPINDLTVLVDNGVLPQNVWTVEKNVAAFMKAEEAISRAKLRNVRSFKGNILDFMEDYIGTFDIIYLDTLSTLPAVKEKTLKIIGYVFRYNKLTSPGALITNFSFPPKTEPKCDKKETEPKCDKKETEPKCDKKETEPKCDKKETEPKCDKKENEHTQDFHEENTRQKRVIRKFVEEYLEYRIVNTWMNTGNPDQTTYFLDKRTDEENYGDYITYQVIDSAYLYIPLLRMLSSTNSGQSNPLWDQMFKSKNEFLSLLLDCKELFDGTKSSPASEESVGNKSFSASTASASNARDDSSNVELSVLKTICIDSLLRNFGSAMEDKFKSHSLGRVWVNEVLPEWRNTPILKGHKLQFLLLTHLLSYFDHFISTFTNDTFQKNCIEPLFEALNQAAFPKFHNPVDLSITRSLVAGLLYGQMAYPSFPVVDKIRRLHYTGNIRQMFTDVFIFDQCRYVYEQFPSTDCASFAITEQKQQMVFRMVVDGLRKHLEDICSLDVFPGCHVASIDPVTTGGTSFPNSKPRIPKRKEMN